MRQDFYISVDEKKDIFIGTFKYLLGQSLCGTATMTVAPDAIYESILADRATIQVAAGTDGIDMFFNGRVQYTDRSKKETYVELVDNGINFKAPYKGNYTNKNLESVLGEIAAECGFTLNTDQLSEFVKEKKITRSPYVEQSVLETLGGDAPIGDTASTITGTFTPDCPKCRTNYENKSYVTSVDNRCRKCGKAYSLKYQDNEFYCEACGSHFCGIDGFEKVKIPIYKLSIVYGPSPGVSYAEKPKYSSSGISCEDEIFRICSANNLYVYKTPKNELIVREFAGFPYPDYNIEDNHFENDTYKTLKPSLVKLKGVDIAYNGGTVSKDIKNITDDPIKERIKLSRFDLDKTSAENLARDTLIQQMKEVRSELEITVPLDIGYSPGKWIRVPFFSQEYPFNITSAMHTIQTGKFTSTLKFKMYPEIFESIDIYSDKYKDTLTFDLMMKTAEQMEFGYVCNSASCIGQKKIGDTYAMSLWLIDKLNRLQTRARLLEYTDPILPSKKKYYTQYKKDGVWTDIDYSKFNLGFVPASIKKDLKVVSANEQ